jgi:adenosylcobinamide-GDP ribazoletransferase
MCSAAIAALLQFCTRLPLGGAGDFDAFARNSYLYPVAGYVVGGITAGVVYFLPAGPVQAAAAIALVMLITGANHFDGLLDLGDGLMAHGSREKRIAALTDRQVGAGGVAAGICVTLLAFAGLLSVASVPVAVIAAEVSAKAAMAGLTAAGKPFKEGIHAYLYSRSKPWFPAAALALCAPLLLLPLSVYAVGSALLAAFAAAIVLLVTAKALFGGVNGDIVGACGEIARAAALCAIALSL